MEIAKHKFEEKINYLARVKKENALFISRERYNSQLQRLLELHQDQTIKKTSYDYRLSKRFAISETELDGVRVRRLVKVGTQLAFVCQEVCLIVNYWQKT
jgi:hypothetical protein